MQNGTGQYMCSSHSELGLPVVKMYWQLAILPSTDNHLPLDSHWTS